LARILADELGAATRALKRAVEGRGYVKRLVGVKGIPDFIVSFKDAPYRPIFVELKHDNTRIHLLQAVCLDELHLFGIHAILLSYRDDGRWDVYHPPFLDKHKRLRTLKTPDTTLENLTAQGLRKTDDVGMAGRSKGGGRESGE
jgi:hypothetical protein